MPKSAPKFCPGGHRQSAKWKTGGPCWQCDAADKARALADPAFARAEREAATAELGPIPDEFVIRSGDGLSVQRFSIPRGMRPRGRR